MPQENFGLAHRDPRGRLHVSTVGIVGAGVVLFASLAGTFLAIANITNRDLQPLPAPVAAADPPAPVEQVSVLTGAATNFTPFEPVAQSSPVPNELGRYAAPSGYGDQDAGLHWETLVNENAPPYPIYWTVLPYELSNGETIYTVAQPEVLDTVRANFLESYAYALFSHGLPAMAQLGQDLTRLTDDGPARQEILGVVTAYYETGTYLRSPPPQNVSIGTESIRFGAAGAAVNVAAFFRSGAHQREQVEIETGATLATEVSPALLVEAILQWDVNQGRWLLARQRTTFLEQG